MKGEGCLAGDTGEGLEPEVEAGPQHSEASDDGELQITVRKLELPVRPRGVLAE
jgi:hypothetical protein